MKLKLILSAALIAGVMSAAAATQNAAAGTNANANANAAMAPLFDDPVIVKGKGFEIKRSELDQVLSGAKARIAAQNQKLPPNFDLEMVLLNQLIEIQLLLPKATPADRAAGQADADLQYTNELKRAGSLEVYERQLRAVGMTVADLRAKAAQAAIAMTTKKRELNVAPTEEDAKEYYTKHAAEFEQPEMAHVRHILLMTIDSATGVPLLTNTVAAKRKQIDELRKRALAGEDFAKLATQYSEDPGSKENGGELPEFPRGQMVPEFESAAFSLSSNQVSEVVTMVYGFHVIKAIGSKTAAKKYNFTDSIPQANYTVAAICKKALEVEKINALAPGYIKKLRTDSNVELLDPVLKARQEKLDADAAAPLDATSSLK